MPKPCQLQDKDDSLSDRVIGDQVRLLAINQLDERLERYRLAQPKLEQQMLKSIRDYGQLSPVVVCQLDGQTVLVDGFKRLRAARTLKGYALVIEDGLQQIEVAQMLGRHKSWVNRRLALIERLCNEAR